jgi:hypothetical protein
MKNDSHIDSHNSNDSNDSKDPKPKNPNTAKPFPRLVLPPFRTRKCIICNVDLRLQYTRSNEFN